ncbi:hypothetical protein ACIQB5_30810 [Streptomyces sp. NPDC088560]|uniref:hypothetical protein n=1 Tax=Streptomyces sp. NPDC088560 TaxID=3365868 RepID=UPI00380DFC64
MGEAADEQDDTYSTAVLGRLLRRALQDDPELREELSAMLPASAAGAVTITASGERFDRRAAHRHRNHE